MSLHWTGLDLGMLAETVADGDRNAFRPGIPRRHTPAGPQEVAVLVDDIGFGVWARFTGTTVDGTPVTVTGACVGGPDLHGEAFTVPVRTFRGGVSDVVVVYVGAGQPVTLVDDLSGLSANAVDIPQTPANLDTNITATKPRENQCPHSTRRT